MLLIRCHACDSVAFMQPTGKPSKYCSADCARIGKRWKTQLLQRLPTYREKAKARMRRATIEGRGKIHDAKKRARPEYRQWLKEYRKRPHVRLRNRVQTAIKRWVTKEQGSPLTVQLTGCTMDFLRAHLESQWERWMNWNNYGKRWVIDHVIPLASFDMSNENDQRKAFHFSNLRPMEKRANILKSDKIIACQPELTISHAA